jgi:hypothetical protein
MKHHWRMVLNVGQKQYTTVIKEVKKGGRKRQKIGGTEKAESEKEEKQAFPFKLTTQLANVLNNSHTYP